MEDLKYFMAIIIVVVVGFILIKRISSCLWNMKSEVLCAQNFCLGSHGTRHSVATSIYRFTSFNLYIIS